MSDATGGTRRALLALAALVIVAGLGTVVFRATKTNAKLKATGDRAALHCAPEEGFKAAFKLRAATKMQFNASNLIGQGNGPDQIMTSEAAMLSRLRVEALKRRDDGMLIAFKIDNIEAEGSGVQTPRELRRELGKPFFAVLDDTCRLRAFAFDPTVPPEAQNRLQAMIQGVSFSLRSSRTQSTWKTQEWDATGQYTARYELGRAPRMFSKARLSYFNPHSSSFGVQDKVTVRVIESSMLVTMDDDDAWLETADGDEHLQLVRENGSLLAELETSITLKKSDDNEPIGIEAPKELSLRADDSPPLRAEQSDPEPPDEMKTLPLDQALAQFAAMVRGDAGIRAIDFLKLYLRARPEMALELIRLIQKRVIPEDLEPGVFHALGVTGTSEAREALVQALGDEFATNARGRAAAAISDIKNPNEKVISSLAKMSEKALAEEEKETGLVRNAGTFALGRLEANLRKTNSPLAGQALTEVKRAFERAVDVRERTAALDAIANAGNPALLAQSKPLMTDESSLVRGHAIQSMENMPIEATKDLFNGLMANEKDPQIRGTIAITYTDQARRANRLPAKEVMDQAIELLPREPDLRVRILLVELLGPTVELYQRSERALIEQFPRESDATMLKLIGKYISADKLR